MHFNIFKTAAWQLILQSDAMGWFILLGLFVTSVFCIAIIIFKYVSFRAERRNLLVLVQRMKAVRSFPELITLSKEFREGIGARFLMSSLSELKTILDNAAKRKGDHAQEGVPSLLEKDIETLEIALSQVVDELIMEQESYMPVLSTCGEVAPLIGLFGTIWGLIRSFVDIISQERGADISTVAPGLAEVLIATLAGLVVAIPALIAFHYFASHVRDFEHQLHGFGDRFLIVVKQTFVK